MPDPKKYLSKSAAAKTWFETHFGESCDATCENGDGFRVEIGVAPAKCGVCSKPIFAGIWTRDDVAYALRRRQLA